MYALICHTSPRFECMWFGPFADTTVIISILILLVTRSFFILYIVFVTFNSSSSRLSNSIHRLRQLFTNTGTYHTHRYSGRRV